MPLSRNIALLISGMMGFFLIIPVIHFSHQVKDSGINAGAIALIKNLQVTAEQVKSYPPDSYVEICYQLPDDIGEKNYTVSFSPSLVRVSVGDSEFNASISVSNTASFAGGTKITFYRSAESSDVYVR